MTVDFYAFVEAADQRKRELGTVETADDVEAMRNKGGNRTQAKRDLLGRMQERAQTPIRKLSALTSDQGSWGSGDVIR